MRLGDQSTFFVFKMWLGVQVSRD